MERAIVILDLILGDNNEKGEEHEPIIKEDKDYKEENTISDHGK